MKRRLFILNVLTICCYAPLHGMHIANTSAASSSYASSRQANDDRLICSINDLKQRNMMPLNTLEQREHFQWLLDALQLQETIVHLHYLHL